MTLRPISTNKLEQRRKQNKPTTEKTNDTCQQYTKSYSMKSVRISICILLHIDTGCKQLNLELRCK